MVKQMTKLNELIQQLCPDGVEYKKLKNAVSIERGKRVVKSQLSQINGFPVYQNSLIPLGYHTECNYPANTTFIIMAGAAGEIGYSKESFWAADDCFSVVCPEEVSNRYIYHILLHKQEVLRSKVRKASIPRLSRNALDEIIVPLPPIEVQREIVRILDDFTEQTEQLKASLTAELTARKKQYEYYRDKLLTLDVFGGGTSKCERRTLGDIAKFTYGYTDKAKNAGDVRFIRITDINDSGYLSPSDAKYIDLTEESKKYLLKKGDLLLARTGATYGKTLFFDSDEPAVYASFLIRIVLDNAVIRNRYYWHFSKSSLYWEQAEKYVSKGGQQQFNANAISRVKVPIPSLEVQDRIINVLDNFDAICSDLNIGLPAEIEARQKQYECYRDKLLTFKEAKA
jgi:type I restriction enzyme S subunit